MPGVNAPHRHTLSQDIRAPFQLKRNDFVVKHSGDIHSEYEITGGLAEGGFSTVFKGIKKRTGTLRAIKSIPKSHTSEKEFQDEVKALSDLDHPHIVRLIEYFEDSGNFYLVEEFCTGPTLVDFLEAQFNQLGRNGASERDTSIILRQCLQSLIGCHANGFIHRDVKLDNFMITGQDATVKMIDFGMATKESNREAKLVAGTFVYMAPELLLADETKYAPSEAVDVWSLGNVLYALLTGSLLLDICEMELEVGFCCEVERSSGRWTPGVVREKHADGTYVVEIQPEMKSNPSEVHVKGPSIRVDEELELKRRLRDPKYVSTLLSSDKVMNKKSHEARDLLGKLLHYVPTERITAAEALNHPFIRKYANDHLGEFHHKKLKLDFEIAYRMRTFACAPRLKQIALLALAHLVTAPDAPNSDRCSFRHVFHMMDKDGDGEVSFEELTRFLQTHKLSIPSDWKQVFQACDSDQRGTINYIEFLAAVLPSGMITEKLCTEVFLLLDREGDGVIKAEDLQLLSKGLRHDPREYEAIIREAERTIESKETGSLTLNEFHCFMAGKTVEIKDGNPKMQLRQASNALFQNH